MDALLQDLRFAIRTLRHNRAFALVAVLTIALGVGANTAIYSFVDALLLRPLPYPSPGELVMLWQDERARSGPADEWTSPPNFLDWRQQNTVFTDVAAFSDASYTLTGEGEAERLQGAVVSAGFFDILGVAPKLGRGFIPADEAVGAGDVAVLSHSLWQRRFGADPSLVGRTIALNGTPVTVAGVAPEGFAFPFLSGAEVWRPLVIDPADNCGRRCIYLRVVGRLKQGVTLEQAQAQMATIGARLAAEYPDANRNVGIAATRLHDEVAGPFRAALLMLLGAVGFLLLIACANVANLLLAQATRRGGEVGVRLALGAGKRRLVRQLLTESLVLAVLGGTVGLLLGVWGVQLLVSMLPPDTPRLGEVGVDGRVLAFTLTVTALTGGLFGLAPALHIARRDLSATLREAGRGARAGGRQRHVRSILVVTELALAVVLLTGAGLLMRSFIALQQVGLGLRTEQVLTARMGLPSARYESEAVAPAYAELLERLRSLPGVHAAAATSTIPLGGNLNDTRILIEGKPVDRPEDAPYTMLNRVTPDFFRALDIPLQRGRSFTERDRSDAPPVAIIDEAFAHSYFAGEDPVGRRLVGGEEVFEIVGVVGEVRHLGPQQEVRPTLYLSHAQFPSRSVDLVLRTTGEPEQLAGALRTEIRALDPQLAASGIRPLTELRREAVAQPRLYMLLLTVFAVVAVSLACFGIYGVISYSVAQRTGEIGLRMALGADAGEVLRMVIRQGLLVAAAGLLIGAALAVGLARLISSLLYGISQSDPFTFAGVVLFLATVAALASYFPARRAARVDPMVALRTE